jgi:signal transduction histidine kinase
MKPPPPEGYARAVDLDRMSRLVDAGLALASELSFESVLRRIVQLGIEITDATYGALGVLDEDGRILEFITEGVSDERRAQIGEPPTGHGLLGVLIHEGKTLRIPDIGSDPRSYGFPPNHPSMHSFLGAPVVAKGTLFGRIYLTEKRGAAEFNDGDARAIQVLAAQAGVAVENARLHRGAARRAGWLEATNEIGSMILTGAGAEAALERIAERARELLAADLAVILTPGPGSDHLIASTAVGEDAHVVRDATVLLEGSITHAVMRSGSGRLIDDLTAEPEGWLASPSMGPAVLLPLTAEDGAIGTLVVANRRGGPRFDAEALHLAETFAAQASVALAFERANRERRRLTVLEDRERIAKDLHDGVIQSLFAVGMGLEGTVGLAKDDQISARIGGAIEEIDGVIRDLRNYIFGLRPGILADRQLDQALHDLAEEFGERTGVVTVVEVDAIVASALAPSAPEVVQLTRELLSNVGRHAGATTCRVSLRSNGDHAAMLEVDDDGQGFDPETADPGMGLANVEQRALTLGGRIEIESVPGEGALVRVILPI